MLQPRRAEKWTPESRCCGNGVQVRTMADSQRCGAVSWWGEPQSFGAITHGLTVDLRRAGGRSHILHPCLSLPHILPDLSSPPLHLPEGLGTLAAALWSKPPPPPVASSCTMTVLDSSGTGALHPGCLPSALQPRLSRPGPFSQCQVHLAEKGQL